MDPAPRRRRKKRDVSASDPVRRRKRRRHDAADPARRKRRRRDWPGHPKEHAEASRKGWRRVAKPGWRPKKRTSKKRSAAKKRSASRGRKRG
jgi:hypothetical protein